MVLLLVKQRKKFNRIIIVGYLKHIVSVVDLSRSLGREVSGFIFDIWEIFRYVKNVIELPFVVLLWRLPLRKYPYYL